MPTIIARLIGWHYSQWIRSVCCNALILMIPDYPKDLDFIYCSQCGRRIGAVLMEDRYDT